MYVAISFFFMRFFLFHSLCHSFSVSNFFVLCSQFRDVISLCAYLCQYFTPYLSQTEWRYSISPFYFFFFFSSLSIPLSLSLPSLSHSLYPPSLTLSTLPLSFSPLSLALSLTLSVLKPNAA